MMLVYLEFSSFGFGCYWGSLVHTQDTPLMLSVLTCSF